jgi:HlyD family secretion protein
VSHRIGIALFVVAVSVPTAQLFRDIPELDVATAAVTAGPVTHRFSANGHLEPMSTVDVVAQIPGTVASIDVTDYAVVHTGQVVAELDATEYEGALLESRATFARTQAEVRLLQADAAHAQSEVSRVQELSEHGLATDVAMTAAWARLANAQNDLVAGERLLSDTQALVDRNAIARLRTAIRSPVDGVIVATEVVKGQSVDTDAGSPVLFRVATDLTHLHITTEFDEEEANTLRPGDTAQLRVDSDPAHTFTGLVSRIVPADNAGTAKPNGGSCAMRSSGGRQTVLIDVANEKQRLHPGEPVAIFLDGTHGPNRLRVPNTALAFRPRSTLLNAIGETHVPAVAIGPGEEEDTCLGEVWTYTGTEFVAVGVRTGYADESWTELEGGALAAGDRVVTSAKVHDWNHAF